MSQSKNRILLIDICRGILILMMTVRHSISMLDINHQHWIYKYCLPVGWATAGFISLSGFLIGMLFLERIRDPITRTKTVAYLHQRSWQLLVVMFISNLFMLVSKLIISGNMSTLLAISWWFGLFTLKTPYSISSILLPTALLIYISPQILKAISRYKVLAVAGASVLLSLITAAITLNIADPDMLNYLLRRCLYVGDGFFPILPMVLYGVISICVGTLWYKFTTRIILINGILYYGVILLYTRDTAAQIILEAIKGPARLIIVLFVCIILNKIVFFRHFNNFFSTIGRFSLLSFLLHRIILQALTIALGIIIPSVSVELLFFVIVVLNLLAIWVTCMCRMRYPKWNAFLRKVYL